MTLFTDLPIEILLHITQHISTAADFLALCTTCHEFSDADDLRYAPSFWSRLSRETFRVPNQPVVAADGRRWCHLYRRMLKEVCACCNVEHALPLALHEIQLWICAYLILYDSSDIHRLPDPYPASAIP